MEEILVNELRLQYRLVRIDLNSGERIQIWNGYNRYFKTLEELQTAMEKDIRNMKESKTVRIGRTNLGITIEESLNAKYDYEISTRYVSKWKPINNKGE